MMLQQLRSRDKMTTRRTVPSFRRYSDSCLPDSTDNRIPPLHDLVATNNDRNDQLNGLDDADCDDNVVEASEDVDDIDDDWFAKLTNSNEAWSFRVLPVDGNPADCDFDSSYPLLTNDDLDFKERTIRTLRVGIKKIWKRGSATITEADPTYKVAYLGNVLTGWAKGEGCIEKPLNTLWKNYSSSSKPDVQMKITVTQSGLKAVTKDHGLTEYWSHRITYCSAPATLPRVFCWVYRHEGRKLKQELRCHAVLCSKESIARRMATTLRLRLAQALVEFKRDKLLRQNARLSLANSVYDNPSLPRRKILLSTGSHNYRPPLERSKSAPKLMSIEESLEEEESSPKSRRKDSVSDEKMDVIQEENDENGNESEYENENETAEDDKPRKRNLDEKYEYKITNLNFVKKLCSSIENLVESTSSYGKKLLTERRSSKEFCLAMKRPEESILKKTSIEEEGLEYCRKSKPRKSVTFEDDDKVESQNEACEFAKCTDYKTSDERSEDVKASSEVPKEPLAVVVEVKDQESSDEGSNSLQSISSCSSDVSSLLTSSSDKSDVPFTLKLDDEGKEYLKDLQIYKTSMERLHTYLNSYEEVFRPNCEEQNKVVLQPTGGALKSTGARPDKILVRSATFPVTNIDQEEVDSLSEDDGNQQEEDVVSDESGYVELAESNVKRLSLDSKEKDVPYHQIIKSSNLRPRPMESSCLQV